MLIDSTQPPVMIELLPEELRVLVAWHDRQVDALDVDDASIGDMHWRQAAKLLQVLGCAKRGAVARSGAQDRKAKTAGDSVVPTRVMP